MAWILGQLFETKHSRDRRGHTRHRLTLDLPVTGAVPGLVRILDLSQAGMMIHCELPIEPGEVLMVDLPESGTIEARIVWKRFALLGCRFVRPLSKATMAAMLLKAHPASPPEG